MRPETEPLTNGDPIHHDDSSIPKDVEREAKVLSLNVATSTPSIPIPGKMIPNGTNAITNSTSTDEGHSPSLLPVSVQWLGQNPNLLGKFLEYYKVPSSNEFDRILNSKLLKVSGTQNDNTAYQSITISA